MARSLSAVLLLCVLAMPVQAQLVLNGSASYQRLSQDIYIGGLYLSQASDDVVFVRSAATAKRMRLVVAAKRWSPRRWQQMWQNNISINNENVSQSAQVARGIQQLTELLREDLLQGDELTIDYQPAVGTRIYLNQQLAIRSSGTELFNFLVNTWIGPLPPSRDFRDRMLGKVKDDLSQRQRQMLAEHKIPSARLGLYKGWVEQELQQQQAAQAAEEAARRKAEQAKREEAERRARILAERKAKEEAERQARLEAERLAQQEAERQRAAEAARLAALEAERAKQQAVDPAEQQRYLAAVLQWRMQNALNAEVAYPAWARQFEQEGLVEVSLTLRRNGDIIEVMAAENGAHKLLISEVQRALQVVASKVEVPEALDGDSWTLPLRYRFLLDDATPLPNPEPKAPEGANMESAGGNDSVSLDAYRQQLISRVRDNIRYPKAAQILKKTGRVSYQLVIAADGQLISSTALQSAAHRELNQAVTSAIDAALPLAPLPAGSDQLVVQIEHEFRL
ncbi:TonB family protein [Bacterioplanes sanyensis]|nr:TonB family protein [Bacterioplanes sanyensis]